MSGAEQIGYFVTSSACKYRLHGFFLWPAGKEEQRKRMASDSRPLDATHLFDARRAEIERAAIKEDDSSAFLYFPQAAPIGTAFSEREQVAMLVNATELQGAILVDDKFLVHGFFVKGG